MSIVLTDLYVDQAPERGFVSAFFTRWGIQKIDSRFHNRIQAFKRGESCTEYALNYSFKPPQKEVEYFWTDTFESLEKDIKENPHLHDKIKENLLYNLRS